jgi:hypothetical protein
MGMLGQTPKVLLNSYLKERHCYNEIKGKNILRILGHSVIQNEKNFK